MAQQWQGKSYNEKWEPIDAAGGVTGARDDAAFNTATGGGKFDWGGWNTGSGGGSASGSSTTSPWAAPNVAPAGPTSGFGQDVQSSIQRDLAPAAVNTNDPAYVAQVNAFRNNEQRSADRQRAAMAQRANAQGTLNSGGFDTQVTRGLQNQGAREADFEAQLMGSELTAARDRTARAQQLGSGLLSQEHDQSLRERLANQQAAIAGRGQQFQEQQGMNDSILRRNALNLQSQLGLGDLGLRSRGMTQQDEQYYAGLGQQLGLSQAQLNQQAMLAMLGGG